MACRHKTLHPKAVVDLVLSLAKFTDSMDVLTVHNKSALDFFHSFFGSEQFPKTPEELCLELQTVNPRTLFSINFLADAAHVIFRYRLLDIASDMLGIPRQDWVAKPQTDSPKYSVQRLDKAFAALENWPEILLKFRRIYQFQSTMDTSSPFSETTRDEKHHIFQAGLRTLHQACMAKSSREYHRVMFNVHIMVFSLWWLGLGFEDFPSDANNLITRLSQCAQELCMSNKCLEDLAQLGSHIDGDSTIASSMRNCYQLAVGISPLLLFVPKKLDVAGIRRDVLIAHVVALGNERPERLHETENAVWTLIFNLVTGVPHEECMKELFEKLEVFESIDEDGDGVMSDWFVRNRNKGTTALSGMEQLTLQESNNMLPNDIQQWPDDLRSAIELLVQSNASNIDATAEMAGTSNNDKWLPKTVNPADLFLPNAYDPTQGKVHLTEPENLSAGTSNILSDEGHDELISSAVDRPHINISTMTGTDGAENTSGAIDTHDDDGNSDDEPSSSDSESNAGPGNPEKKSTMTETDGAENTSGAVDTREKSPTSSSSEDDSDSSRAKTDRSMGVTKSEAKQEILEEIRSGVAGKGHAKFQVMSEDSENDGGDESEASSTGNVPSHRVTRSTKTLRSPSKANRSPKTEPIPRMPDLPFLHKRKKPPVKINIDDKSDGEKEGETKGAQEKKTISLKLPGADHKAPLTTWNFTAPSNTGKDYLSLVSSVVQGTKNHYRNNRPPHHLANARQVEYSHEASMFYMTTAAEFERLTAVQVQSIFRHRNIVVSGPAPNDFKFDRRGLSTLGSLTTPRQIQVNAKTKSGGGKFDQLRIGTLKDLLGSDGKGSKSSLNILDIPMGGAAVPTPIQYGHLASNEKAWQETRDFPACMTTPFPTDIFLWGTATTQDTVTFFHEDDGGSGTSIKIMAGCKFWVIARPKRDKKEPGSLGDMGSAFAFPAKTFDSGSSNSDLWDYEGILLVAGDTLYMRPNTMHFVVTLSDSIAYGRHFYASSTMRESVFGLVHTFMFGDIITNTRHDDLGTMFRRMMGMWYSHYEQEAGFDASINPHVPDMSTEEGLLDIMTLGNVMECAKVLDRRCYLRGELHWQELAEIAGARWWYRMLQIRFDERYVVTVGGKPISSFSVFRRSLVEFAAALVVYKSLPQPGKFAPTSCTAKNLELKLVKTFESNYPELLPCLRRLISGWANTLYWTGPPIKIRLRSEEDKNSPPPPFDFDDLPIYCELSEVKNDDDDDVEMEAETNGGSTKDLEDVEMELEAADDRPKKSPRRLRSHQKGESNKTGRPLDSDSAAEVPRKKKRM